METKLMAHITTGPRDGWGTVAPFLRGALSFLADAFPEMNLAAYRIWRHQGYTYNGQTNLDIFPGFDQLTIEDMPDQAAYWWPIIQAQAVTEEKRLGIRFDAIKVTNEVGGGGDLPDTDYALQKLVAFERAILPLAEADGRTILVCNCATNSPQWDDWTNIIAPFVIEAAGRGHIYGRHVYASDIDGIDYLCNPDSGLPVLGGPTRVFDELDYFRSLGYKIPTVIGELGFYSFPGNEWFLEQVGFYDEWMQRYSELGGGCLFTYGNWGNANIQTASMSLADYLRVRPFAEWLPQFEGPQPPPANETKEQRIWRLTIEEQIAHGLQLAPTAIQDAIRADGMHPVTKEMYLEGEPPMMAAEDWTSGIKPRTVYYWEGGTVHRITDPEVTPPAFKLVVWPTEYKVITQVFGANPADYAKYGLPGHEGLDIRAPLGSKIFAAARGRVYVVETDPTASNYGIHCRIEHDGGYRTIYAHLQECFATVGDTVGAGALIGLADSTGNSTGSHLHFGMKHYPDGIFGWPSNIIDPTPHLKPLAPEAWEPVPPPPPPPPVGETINIRPYFEPAGDVGPMKVLAWLDGSRTQPQQLLKRDGFVIEAKGEGQLINGRMYYDYERWQFAGGNMKRWEDTSMGNLQGYTQHGARWLPEVCTIGKQYINSPLVTAYNLTDCSVISNETTTDYLTVTKHYATWNTSAGTINDVIEIEWRKSPAGPVQEVYYAARGMGYVGWGIGTLTAVLSDLPQGRTPLNPALWSCG